MNIATGLAELLRRDITRLVQQLEAFPGEETLWKTAPGVTNSAGNLLLHLEGNLREFVGRLLGNVPYTRERDREFSNTGIPAAQLKARLTELADMIPRVTAGLTDATLESEYPHQVLGKAMPTHQFLIHLLGHLNYHMGQIDYARRLFTGNGSIKLAGL